MNKETFEALIDKKMITDVDLVDYYQTNPEALEKLSMETLMDIGVATELSTNQYILPDFSKGGNFILSKDLCIAQPIVVEGDLEIDLNGHDIVNDVMFVDESDGSTNCYVFWVKSGKLIIKGEGEVKAIAGSQYDMAVWANGGAVEIYGGRFVSGGTEGDGGDCIYTSAKGTVDIYDGRFECLNINNKSFAKPQYGVLNEKGNNQGTIHCYGGEYVKFNPSDNISENPKRDFCADGYESVLVGDNVWKVQKKEEDIIVEEDAQ